MSNLGYEVVNREWKLLTDGAVEIVIVVRPQMDASGHYPFNYEEEVAELAIESAAEKFHHLTL